jgi:hypothetical protein
MGKYEKRLLIPVVGCPDTRFYVRGFLVSIGYNRIVIGGRGPYIEFLDSQIQKSSIYIPEKELWRLNSPMAFYHEYRTKQGYVKFYYQIKTVDYADYQVGYWYASPFDLQTENKQPIIKPHSRYKEIEFE